MDVAHPNRDAPTNTALDITARHRPKYLTPRLLDLLKKNSKRASQAAQPFVNVS